jgi:hypothetical protein
MNIALNSPNCFRDTPYTKTDIADVLLDTSLVVGIDKLRMVMPYRSRIGGFDMWQKVSGDPRGSEFWGHVIEDFGEGTLYIGFSEGGVRECSLEFNPSRVLHGHDRLATGAEMMTLISDALVRSFHYVEGPLRPEDIRVTRLDLTVDFAPVLDLAGVISEFSKSQPVRNSVPQHYRNRSTNAPETVTFGKAKNVQVKAYDKSHQMRTGNDWLRFEISAFTRELKKFGLQSLEATDEQRANCFRNRLMPLLMRWTNSPASIRETILDSPAEMRMLIKAAGLEYLDSFGCHPSVTRNFKKDLRAFQNRYLIYTVKDLFGEFQ